MPRCHSKKIWRNLQVGSQCLLVTWRDEKVTIYTVPFKHNFLKTINE